MDSNRPTHENIYKWKNHGVPTLVCFTLGGSWGPKVKSVPSLRYGVTWRSQPSLVDGNRVGVKKEISNGPKLCIFEDTLGEGRYLTAVNEKSEGRFILRTL